MSTAVTEQKIEKKNVLHSSARQLSREDWAGLPRLQAKNEFTITWLKIKLYKQTLDYEVIDCKNLKTHTINQAQFQVI